MNRNKQLVQKLGTLIVIFALLLAIPVLTSAQGGGTWVTSFQVQNLGSSPATISIYYYDENGNLKTTQSFSNVQPGSSINVYQPNVPGLPDGFKGSVQVSADQPIAAIGSEMVTYSDGRIGNSQYSGVAGTDSGMNKYYLPLVDRRFGGASWSSEITIQNASASPVSVTVTFYDSSGNPISGATQNPIIAGNGSVTLKQIENPGLSDGYLGSAVVQATNTSDRLAVIVNQISADGRVETYNGFSSGSLAMYLPTLLLHFGGNDWVTSFQIMNVGSAPASVTVEYYSSGSSSPVKTVRYNGDENPKIQPFTSVNRYQPSVDSDLGNGWIGSVRITSDQPVVAVASQSSSVGTKASIYNGFSEGSTTVYLPTILKNFGGGNWVTSFQVMNVGSSDASVTIEYYAQGSSVATKTVRYNGVENPKIKPFNSINRYQPNVDADLPAGWIGAVKIISDQPVVALGSQNSLNKTGDTVAQYNGLWGR